MYLNISATGVFFLLLVAMIATLSQLVMSCSLDATLDRRPCSVDWNAIQQGYNVLWSVVRTSWDQIHIPVHMMSLSHTEAATARALVAARHHMGGACAVTWVMHVVC